MAQVCAMACLLLFVWGTRISAGDQSTAPKLNQGAKWRIGCYEGGEYANYQHVLVATVKGLMDLGWIEKKDILPQEGMQTKKFWDWLATEAKSSYLQFVSDAHYSANWDKSLRKEMAARIISRLNEKKDIDLMFAMGTWAGQDLASSRHQTFTMVMSSSDPVASGIVKSAWDSGYRHVHARVDPFRYVRQIRVFHHIIGFKKLGLPYQNSAVGRTYAALGDVENVAKEKGFEIAECYTEGENVDVKTAGESVKKCFRELAKKADAIYVTNQIGVNKKSIPELADIANSHRIPSFCQTGIDGVKQGLLMTVSLANFKHLGEFEAVTAAKIMNGAPPGGLTMYAKVLYKWEINFETAEKIGLDISKLDLERDYIHLSDFFFDASEK